MSETLEISEDYWSSTPQAFPIVVPWQGGVSFASGMALRDYFAAKALAGLLAGPDDGYVTYPSSDATAEECFAVSAYRFADAMMEARK